MLSIEIPISPLCRFTNLVETGRILSNFTMKITEFVNHD
jgi:hypothetical protein